MTILSDIFATTCIKIAEKGNKIRKKQPFIIGIDH